MCFTPDQLRPVHFQRAGATRTHCHTPYLQTAKTLHIHPGPTRPLITGRDHVTVSSGTDRLMNHVFRGSSPHGHGHRPTLSRPEGAVGALQYGASDRRGRACPIPTQATPSSAASQAQRSNSDRSTGVAGLLYPPPSPRTGWLLSRGCVYPPPSPRVGTLYPPPSPRVGML